MNLGPVWTLWQREVVRFLRQRDRVVGALLTPVVFWLLLGGGLGRAFQMPGAPPGPGYLEYFFAGTLVMILLFTAIFSTISVIEDRREGFLQGVLVAPVGAVALVVGKVFGGATLAVLQGGVFLALAPLAGLTPAVAALGWLLLVMALLGVALTGLGFVIAWRMQSTQGFHAIMNLFLLPLWLLSGAVFPAASAAAPLAWVIRCNPLTYGVDAVRLGLQNRLTLDGAAAAALAITAVFAVVMFGLAVVVARRPTPGDAG